MKTKQYKQALEKSDTAFNILLNENKSLKNRLKLVTDKLEDMQKLPLRIKELNDKINREMEINAHLTKENTQFRNQIDNVFELLSDVQMDCDAFKIKLNTLKNYIK